FERLRDAFAGHAIDDTGRVTGVQHAIVRESCRVVLRGKGPRARRTLGARVRTEALAYRAAIEQSTRDAGQLLAPEFARAQHTEPDIGAAVADRKHPGISRKKIALEDHPEPRIIDLEHVLTERVPRAEIAHLVTDQASHRGVVTVGRDDIARPELVAGRQHDVDAARVAFDSDDADAGAHLDAVLAGVADQRGVERRARDDGGIAAVDGKRQDDLAAAGGSEPDV